MFTLLESMWTFCGVNVAPSLVSNVMYYGLLSCPFSFDHFIISSSSIDRFNSLLSSNFSSKTPKFNLH
jgi:hypothetical protein